MERSWMINSDSGGTRRLLNRLEGDDMSTEFWIQMVIYAVTIGSFAGTTLTRLKNLERKMDKHNGMMERRVYNKNWQQKKM